MSAPDWLTGTVDVLPEVGAAVAVVTVWLRTVARPFGRWVDARIKTATAPLATTLAAHTQTLEGLRRDVDDARTESTHQHAEVSKRIDRLSDRIDTHLQSHGGDGR